MALLGEYSNDNAMIPGADGVAHRGLRADRGLPHRRAGWARRLHRLAVLSEIRLGCLLRLAAGNIDHGRWLIAPAGEVQHVQRRYRQGTLVLETEYRTDGGAVRLIDFMPQRSRTPALMRIVEGVSGTVPMHMDLAIRFDYGSVVPWVRRTPHGIRATAGPETLYCRTDAALTGRGLRTVAEFTVTAGQRVPVRAGVVTHSRERARVVGSRAESSGDRRVVDCVV